MARPRPNTACVPSLALTRPVSAPPQDPPFCRRPAVYIYSYERANESRRVVETEGVVFTSLSNCIMHADAPLQFDLADSGEEKRHGSSLRGQGFRARIRRSSWL